jgi:hypothetical protein
VVRLLESNGRESRPPHQGPAQSISTAIKAASQQSTLLADLDALAEHLRARFVVQVTIDGDHRRTNVYRSAAAAERAVDRATARGQRAHVTLCQMLPVGVVVGLGVST